VRVIWQVGGKWVGEHWSTGADALPRPGEAVTVPGQPRRRLEDMHWIIREAEPQVTLILSEEADE